MEQAGISREIYNSEIRIQLTNGRRKQSSHHSESAWGGTPLCTPYRYVPPHRVGFSRRFGLKTDIRFAHFGLESGMVFERTTECMNVFIVSIPNE